MTTPTHGYYRQPTIAGETIVFVSEDDLWTVPSSGGAARRLTVNVGSAARPQLSRDGKRIAFTATEEGHAEIYSIPASGGEARRLTWLGSDSLALGWTPDGKSVAFASNYRQHFFRPMHAFTVAAEGGEPQPMNLGPAEAVSWGPHGARVIGRSMGDPARWKRYKGGTTGDLWIDLKGRGEFTRLITLAGNLAWPHWIGDRIYFVSDHEGEGNLWSCTPAGGGLRRETNHRDFYVRFANTDGRRIVYQCGADLYVFEPETRKTRKVAIEFGSPRAGRQRKFVDASRWLEDARLHPEGHSVCVTARGRAFSMAFWEGPVRQVAGDDLARARHTRFLRDGKGYVGVTDVTGDEAIHVIRDGEKAKILTKGKDIGRVLDLAVSPATDEIAFTNQRQELWVCSLKNGKLRRLDRSQFDRISGIAWAPDGKWIAYGFAATRQTSQIRVVEVKTGKTHEVTSRDFRDYSPSWDPDGKNLYFLSFRVLDPVYDSFYFDLGFQKGTRPHLVTLKKETGSPFLPQPKPVVRWNRRVQDQKKEKKGPQPVEIDFDGIAGRVVGFPVPEGRYGTVIGMRGKVAFVNNPVVGALDQHWSNAADAPGRGSLDIWDFDKQKCESWCGGVSDVAIAGDLRTFVVRSGNRLRIVGADEKPRNEDDAPGRESGWLDLHRLRLSVTPALEWEQMLREAWRLQRDQFWRADMAGMDWKGVYARYRPLLDRAGSRSELSDLIWEMQGELRTSHCYEIGGDYRWPPQWRIGQLGADLSKGKDGKWRIGRIVRGDSWDTDHDSPLARPGVNAKVGEAILQIAGRDLDGRAPGELLQHRAGHEIEVVLEDAKKKKRTVVVKTLRSEIALRYRAWVEGNRQWVHKASAGRVGYVHIPNMGADGFAEFHRYFYAEVDHDGLLVDVRHNGGGHVSQLLLEKLARRRLGYDVNRYGAPAPYPSDAPMGPMVALTDEFAGSDGDIFSHCFKLMKLGPLVGKRTWGGVVGIWPRHALVDGCVTTQPEFSFWFHDVGYAVENYGTDPDIEVENRPQDYAAGRDPQLEKGLAEVTRLLKANPPRVPEFDKNPGGARGKR